MYWPWLGYEVGNPYTDNLSSQYGKRVQRGKAEDQQEKSNEVLDQVVLDGVANGGAARGDLELAVDRS